MKMKKTLLYLGFIVLAALTLGGCGNKKTIRSIYVGKWDMTHDKESNVQKTIEINEGNNFVETWTVYDDDGNLYGEVKIQGRCESTETEGNGYTSSSYALSLIYDLESLSDPEEILKTFEMEDYFKDENDSYKAAKEQGKVYGFQDVHINGSTLHYTGGKWELIDEDLKKLMEGTE